MIYEREVSHFRDRKRNVKGEMLICVKEHLIIVLIFLMSSGTVALLKNHTGDKTFSFRSFPLLEISNLLG